MSTAEFEARLPVWTALANLFLDTTHSPDIRRGLAADLLASGFEIEQIEEVLRHEVAPVFGGNLLSLTGEWVLWDQEEVGKAMFRVYCQRRGPTFFQRIQGRLATGLAQSEWKKVRRLVRLNANRASDCSGQN